MVPYFKYNATILYLAVNCGAKNTRTIHLKIKASSFTTFKRKQASQEPLKKIIIKKKTWQLAPKQSRLMHFSAGRRKKIMVFDLGMHCHKANCRKSFRNNVYVQPECLQLFRLTKWTKAIISSLPDVVSGFALGLKRSPADSVERITSWFDCFSLGFLLGIAQLSKYNCHMLICSGAVGILEKTPMLVASALCRPRLRCGF